MKHGRGVSKVNEELTDRDQSERAQLVEDEQFKVCAASRQNSEVNQPHCAEKESTHSGEVNEGSEQSK